MKPEGNKWRVRKSTYAEFPWLVQDCRLSIPDGNPVWCFDNDFYTFEAAIHYAHLRAAGVVREVATRKVAFFDRTMLMERAEAYRRGAVTMHARAQRRIGEALAEAAEYSRRARQIVSRGGDDRGAY